MTDLAIADPPVSLVPPATPLPLVVARPAPREMLHRAAGWSLVAVIVAAALVAGLILRRWAWDQTEPIRYVLDINNAYQQGTKALKVGYIDRYDQELSDPDTRGGAMDLDYAPGRLAVAALWTHWVRAHFNPPMTDFDRIVPRVPSPPLNQQPSQFYVYARDVHRQYELVRPMLMVNLGGEILSAIALFLLVRRYTSGRPEALSGDPALRGTSETGFGGSCRYHPIRGNVLGLIAALFFWFDPALISNAHCWPQWDSWVMPFFLWAMLLASWDCWFCSGFVIATGAMFKGQILFGAPVFLLWPLFQGRLPALCRWIVGLSTAVAMITAVWLVRIPGAVNAKGDFIPGTINPNAIAWLVYLALIFAAMSSVLWWPRNRYARIPVAAVLAATVMWVIGAHTNHAFSVIGFLVLTAAAWFTDSQCARWSWHAKLPLGWLVVALLIYPLYALAKDWLIVVVIATVATGMLLAFAPRRVLPYAAAGWISAALLLCMPLFGASRGWFDLGFAYGTHHYERMASGTVDNLPELLQSRWGWDDLMAPAVTLPAGAAADHVGSFLNQVDPGVNIELGRDINLPLKYFLVAIWLISVVICAIGTAIHDRNRSPRFLVAMVAPWIMFFAVMTQMHQRYLVWGAGMSAASAVVSPGYALLHLFLSTVSASQEMQSMMNNLYDPNRGQYTHNAVYQFIDAWHPGIAWPVLLTAGIFVYTAVKWDRRRDG